MYVLAKYISNPMLTITARYPKPRRPSSLQMEPERYGHLGQPVDLALRNIRLR